MSHAMSEWAPQDTGNLFEPDTLLPEQFYATLRKSYYSDPERRLMAAVLEDVIACLSVDPSRCAGRQQRDFHDAQYWINAPDNSNWAFSFSSISEALGIDPGYLRRGLNQWVVTCKGRTSESSQSRPDRSRLRHKHFRLRA